MSWACERTHRHTWIPTFQSKGSSRFQLAPCLAPLQQALGIGSSPSVKGLIALVLEQLLDLHPQLCKPGRDSALLLLLLLGPASGAVGPVAGLYCGQVPANTCAGSVFGLGGKVCPGLLNANASSWVRSNRNRLSRVLSSPAPSDRQQLSTGCCGGWNDGASVLLNVSHKNEIPHRFSYNPMITWVSYLVGTYCCEYRGRVCVCWWWSSCNHCWEHKEASPAAKDQMSLCELHQATSDGELVCPIASSISFAKKKKKYQNEAFSWACFQVFFPCVPQDPRYYLPVTKVCRGTWAWCWAQTQTVTQDEDRFLQGCLHAVIVGPEDSLKEADPLFLSLPPYECLWLLLFPPCNHIWRINAQTLQFLKQQWLSVRGKTMLTQVGESACWNLKTEHFYTSKSSQATKPDDKQSWHTSERHWAKYKPECRELGTRSWLGTRPGSLRRWEGLGEACWAPASAQTYGATSAATCRERGSARPGWSPCPGPRLCTPLWKRPCQGKGRAGKAALSPRSLAAAGLKPLEGLSLHPTTPLGQQARG